MRKRLASSFAVLLCGIYLVICATPYAAAFSNLDDLPIDPWKDLEDMQNRPVTIPETPEQLPEVEVVPEESEEVPPLRGGASTWSLNDDNMTRYIRVTGYIRYGVDSNDSQAVTNTQMIKTYEGAGYYNIGLYEPSKASNSFRIAASPEAVLEWEAPVGYAAQEDAKLVVNGTVMVKLTASGAFSNFIGPGNTSQYAQISPTGAQLMINQVPYGDVIPVVNGSFSLAGIEVPLDEDVTRLAYRFTFAPNPVNDLQTISTYPVQRSCYFFIDDSSVFTVEVKEKEPEYNGMLSGIIGWLENLWNAITGLGSTIVNGLLDGIIGLFVPDEEEMAELQEQYSGLLEERLGFIYQTYDWTKDTVTGIVETMKTQDEYSFVFPGISFPYNGEIIVLVEEQEVSLDNALMDVLRPVLGTVVSLIAVAAWAEMAFDMFIAVVSGISYFTFLSRRREED